MNRVVFDTSTVLSALPFPEGRLAWLRRHWRQGECVPLLSNAAFEELGRVLSYPKFGKSGQDRIELLADYVPFCTFVKVTESCPQVCRDGNDQPFLDLAHAGDAHLLVSGDKDLLVLAGQATFAIQTPEAYRLRVLGGR